MVFVITDHTDDEFIRNIARVFTLFNPAILIGSIDDAAGLRINYPDESLGEERKIPGYCGFGEWLSDRASITIQDTNVDIAKPWLVLLNKPLPSEELERVSENHLVAGYTDNDGEFAKLREMSPDLYIFQFKLNERKENNRVTGEKRVGCSLFRNNLWRNRRSGEDRREGERRKEYMLNVPDCGLRYISHTNYANYLEMSKVTGLLTRENVDSVLAAGLRRDLYNPIDQITAGCGVCDRVRAYYLLQEMILAKDGPMEERLKELFRFGWVQEPFVMEKPGDVCYDKRIPLDGRLKRIGFCSYRDKIQTGEAYLKFFFRMVAS